MKQIDLETLMEKEFKEIFRKRETVQTINPKKLQRRSKKYRENKSPTKKTKSKSKSRKTKSKNSSSKDQYSKFNGSISLKRLPSPDFSNF